MRIGDLKIDKKGRLVLKAAGTGAERIVQYPMARVILTSLAEIYLIEVDSEHGARIKFKNF